MRLLVRLSLFVLPASLASAEDFQLKLNMEPALDVAKAWTWGHEEVEKQFSSDQFKENPFVQWSKDKAAAQFGRKPYANINVDLTLGDLALNDAQLILHAEDKLVQKMAFTLMESSPESASKLRSRMAALIGAEAQLGPRPAAGWKAEKSMVSEAWISGKGIAVVQQSARRVSAFIGRAGMSADELVTGVRAAALSQEGAAPTEMEFFVRLDELLPVPKLWEMSQDQLEARIRLADTGLTKSPFYEWSTTTRDSARFARDLYANTKCELLLFNDSVTVEEANLEFVNGQAVRLVLTLLSRGGNRRTLLASDFDQSFKATGRALGAMLGVRPQHTAPGNRALIKKEGYLWTTPHTIALMEFNAEAPKGDIELLQLTLTPANQKERLMNLTGRGAAITARTGRQLLQSVKKDAATGDIEILGVPMRDQGQKGYCVAASAERLLLYLGQSCTMDELAKVCGSDAQRGTSTALMYGALAKIDQSFYMQLRLELAEKDNGLGQVVKNKTEYEQARAAALPAVVKRSIDQGLPLLWCVLLSPEMERSVEPMQRGMPQFPRPQDPAELVGHMRMITGYNEKTSTLIYTDSWGAGHERKLMPMDDAKSMTTALFSMRPSR